MNDESPIKFIWTVFFFSKWSLSGPFVLPSGADVDVWASDVICFIGNLAGRPLLSSPLFITPLSSAFPLSSAHRRSSGNAGRESTTERAALWASFIRRLCRTRRRIDGEGSRLASLANKKKKGTDFEDFFKKWNRCFIGLDSTLRHGRLLAGRGHVTADRWVTAAVFFGNSDIKITHPIGEWFIGQVVFHHRTCRATRTATFEGFSFFFFFFYFFFFYFFFFYFPSGDPPSSTPPPSVLSISQSTTEASVHVGRR